MKTFKQLSQAEQDRLVFQASNMLASSLAGGLQMFPEGSELQIRVEMVLRAFDNAPDRLAAIRENFAQEIQNMAKAMVANQIYDDTGRIVNVDDLPGGTA